MSSNPTIVAHRKNTTNQFVDAEHAPWFECDIRATKDGVPVLLHDETVANLPLDRAEVWRHNFSEFEHLDTFAHAIEMAKIVEPRIGVMAEIKPEDPKLVEAVIKLLRTHAGPWKILSFVPANLHHARSVDPKIACALLVETPEQVERAITEKWPEVFGEHKLLNEKTAAQFRTNNAILGAWTVNDPIDIWRMWKLQVDFLITDVPRTARDVLEKIHARESRDNPPKIG